MGMRDWAHRAHDRWHAEHRGFGRGDDFLGHRGHHHHHGGHSRWRRGRGRMFDQGDLRLVFLKLIADKPRHGYDLIKAIEESVGGAYSPSPGVVYPTLTLLEEQGFIVIASTEGGKKLYAVTDEGTAFLETNKALVEGLSARIDAAKEHFGGGPSPQVQRGIENFRTALRLRLSRGALTEEQGEALAALLDEAARGIEKI